MFGLLGFGSIAAWFALSLWIAWRVAKLVKPIWFKAIVILALGPLLFVAPVADDLIGKYQFERYCKEAKEVKIYGTIPVGLDLYTADGKWKLSNGSLPVAESNRLQSILDSIVHWDLGNGVGVEVPGVIPIRYRDTRIYEVGTGKFLAEFRIYSTRGGWLSRLLFERAGFFVKPQCLPPLFQSSAIDRTILPFDVNAGEAK